LIYRKGQEESEDGCRKTEVRSRKSEERYIEALGFGSWNLGLGYWILEFGSWDMGLKIWDFSANELTYRNRIGIKKTTGLKAVVTGMEVVSKLSLCLQCPTFSI